MAGETQLLELRRLYHCAAYNCAMGAISCSFSEPKFYQGFLFSEKPEKVRTGFESPSPYAAQNVLSSTDLILSPFALFCVFFLLESIHP